MATKLTKKQQNEEIHAKVMNHAREMAKRSPWIAERIDGLDKVRPAKLLRTNTKTEKVSGRSSMFLVSLLNLLPAKLSGHNLCSEASPVCVEVCNMLNSGLRIQDGPQHRAAYDTLWFFADPQSFLARLHAEIESVAKKATKLGLRAAIRLNGASDLDWTSVIAKYESDSRIVFYDYTKVRSRFKKYLAGLLPANYSLVFSASETSDGGMLAGFVYAGGNVVVVADIEYLPAVGRIGEIPRKWEFAGSIFDTFDADKHDIRIPGIDGRGRVGVLRMKGASNATKATGVAGGFARPVA